MKTSKDIAWKLARGDRGFALVTEIPKTEVNPRTIALLQSTVFGLYRGEIAIPESDTVLEVYSPDLLELIALAELYIMVLCAFDDDDDEQNQ